MILAGDIGGTKTVLALIDRLPDGSTTRVKEASYSSHYYPEFDGILDAFLPPGTQLSSACFGIVGPIVNQQCQMTNLSWSLDAAALKAKLGVAKVRLLNDLEAIAIGMLHLPAHELVELNPNATAQTGNIAVIAAGTGLGEAILYWDGENHHPIATEGGHCDFAPQNHQQDRLLAYLRKLFPDHVSYERVLSGIGFSHLYDYLLSDGFAPACLDVPKANGGVDRNAVISHLGVTGQDPLCTEAVRLFVEIYGAEAGNLALKAFAFGGIFIGGGIAPKILPTLKNGGFLQAFNAKGRYLPLLDKVSIKISFAENLGSVARAERRFLVPDSHSSRAFSRSVVCGVKMQGLTTWRKVIVQRCWRSPCWVAGESNRTNPGSRQALAVALSFCRLIGLGCPKQAFAKIATPRERTHAFGGGDQLFCLKVTLLLKNSRHRI
jgi:glucokinase